MGLGWTDLGQPQRLARLTTPDLTEAGHNAAPIEEKPVTTTLQTRPIARPQPAVALPPDPFPGAEYLTVTADRVHPGTVVITVHGEVDLLTSPLLLDALRTHLPGPGAQLIIDLTAVDFFGAAGLTVLDTIRHETLTTATRLRLVANTRPVLLPLTITGMHTLFDIHPDLTHALRASAGGPDG